MKSFQPASLLSSPFTHPNSFSQKRSQPVGHDMPDIRLASSDDGLGLVLVIANRAPIAATVFEPHPHTSVQLFDPGGEPWPMHYGVFAAHPRWQVTLLPGEVQQRIVTLPRFFLDARGVF